MFSIEKASVNDIPLVRELTYKVWPQTYAGLLSQEQIDYMLEMMYSPSSLEKQMKEGARFLFVYDEKEPVGFASYQEMEPGIYKLHKIYVLPSHQRRGLGRFVIDHIMNEIQQRKAKALQLQVNRHNNARDFYERLGFTAIDEINLDIGNGFFMRDYIMEKKL
jgi:diamine N-acetyltransferase